MTIQRFAVVQFIVIVALALAVFVSAQTPPQGVISGADIGFRLERVERDRAIGRLLVRIDGKWLEAGHSGGVVPLHTK
jgi:hypothetical protein